MDGITGTYEGSGKWYDSAGKSMSYKVTKTNRVTAGGLEMEFKHDFDDGSTTDARFVMSWIAPHIFRVEIGNHPVGHGYSIGDSWKYHIKAGDSFVEVSYRPEGERLDV